MCSTKWLVVVVVTALAVMVGFVKADQYCTFAVDDPDPPPHPDIPLQYTAKMETMQDAVGEDYNHTTLVEYDEWVYDGPRNRIALRTYSEYNRDVHLFDWDTKQMLKLKSSEDENECLIRPVTEALALFPVIFATSQEVSLDQIPVPGAPIGILNWTDAHLKGVYMTRYTPSFRWEWCGLHEYEEELQTQTVSMATYWSKPPWSMPIPTDERLSIPLGWEVVWWDSFMNFTIPQRSNIMYYEPGLVDEAAFIIPEDIYCPGMVPREGHPFPDFQDNFFSFSLEYRETDSKSFTWADTWYDFEKKLYRIDHDSIPPTGRATTSTSTITTTLLLDYNDGVAFEFVPGELAECQVSLVSQAQGGWSELTGLDHLWGDSPSAFFGSDTTNYTYYGPREERYMVVDNWRGVRLDWPLNAVDPDPRMLWQWSFTNKNVSTMTDFGGHIIAEKQVPSGVRITARENINTTEGLIPKGFSIMYTMYDFEVTSVGKIVQFNGLRIYDAYDCFSSNWRDHLRFKLDLSSWPEVLDLPLLTSVYLNEYWQVILARHGNVSPFRITRVQTIIEETDEVWVEFVLLYRHWRIGDLDSALFKNMTTGAQARMKLTSAINNGDIKYEGQRPDGQDFVILAVYGSLGTVIEPECTTTTSTTTTTATTNSHGHHTTPPHHKTTTTTTTTTSPTSTSSTTTDGGGHHDNDQTLYTPGDLAGLGIGMLLMGFAFGAGGTFLVVVKGAHQTLSSCCSKG